MVRYASLMTPYNTSSAAAVIRCEQHRCACHGGNAFAAAGEAEAFGGRRLDRYARDVEREKLCEVAAHGIAMRADLGLLADDGNVDVGQLRATR